jgi:hypothetical protein
MHRPLPILRLKISLRVTDNEWRDKQELVKLGLVLQEDLLSASILEAYWS